MSEPITQYKPSRWGEVFHSLPHEEALGAGSAGPGKTFVLLMDPFQQIMVEQQRCNDLKHPHRIAPGTSRGWALHLRRTMPMLEQTIVKSETLFPQIDPGACFNQQTHTWKFSSGYRYQFGHCKDPSDWQQYFSNEYTYVGFDELVQFEEEQYEQISGRVRTSDPVLAQMLKVRAMSNPVLSRQNMENVSINDPLWVRKRFVDPAPEGRVTLYRNITLASGEVIKRRRIYLPATLYDNPDPAFVRQYEASLRDKPIHIQKALLYGDWYFTSGSYYTDWTSKLHTCKPFNIPGDWLRFRSMDWGYKAPGCVHWWAMDDDGNIYCERELTFQKMTATAVAERIKQIEIDLKLWKGKSLIIGPADTQLWEERGETSKTKADEMSEVGVGWMRADKKARTRNAQLLQARLADHHGGTTTAGIVFFDTCKMAIKTLPSIVAVQNDVETPADGGDDHWHDSVLYACAFASRGRKGIPAKRKEQRHKSEKPASRGRSGYGEAY